MTEEKTNQTDCRKTSISQLQHVDLKNNPVFMVITQGCRKLKDLQFDDLQFDSEDYKKANDDLPAVMMKEGQLLTVKGGRELAERARRKEEK